MDEIQITIVQSNILWEQPDENLKHYSELLEHEANCDIIIFPEMFTSGFSTHPSSGIIDSAAATLEWMKLMAKSKNTAVCGSCIVSENNRLLNRFYFISPVGDVNYYDKKHLFTMGGEHTHFSSGSKQTTVSYAGINIRPFICYDLRFPVWNRNRYNYVTGKYEYDLLIYVANWPEKRIHHWETLLRARAIENQSFVCGVNRIGNDENGIVYNGNSMVINPLGEIIIVADENKEMLLHASIQPEMLSDIRRKLPFSGDWDDFKLISNKK